MRTSDSEIVTARSRSVKLRDELTARDFMRNKQPALLASRIFDDRRDRKPGAALGLAGPRDGGRGRARDVDVHPRRVLGKRLQEQPRGDRAAVAIAGVAHVGDLALELLAQPADQ